MAGQMIGRVAGIYGATVRSSTALTELESAVVEPGIVKMGDSVSLLHLHHLEEPDYALGSSR